MNLGDQGSGKEFESVRLMPRVSIGVPFLVDQNLYYRILTIKLVNHKKELQWVQWRKRSKMSTVV